MKTTIEIPDDLLRRSKATAALAGMTLKEFVTAAIEEHLERRTGFSPRVRGWRTVYGTVSPEDVAEVDAVIAGEFETIDPEDWR